MLENAIKLLFAVSLAAGSIAAVLSEYKKLVNGERVLPPYLDINNKSSSGENS